MLEDFTSPTAQARLATTRRAPSRCPVSFAPFQSRGSGDTWVPSELQVVQRGWNMRGTCGGPTLLTRGKTRFPSLLGRGQRLMFEAG